MEHACDWPNEGATLALSAGSKVSLWNAEGEPVGEPIKFPRAVVDLAWVLGGQTLAIAMSSAVHLRDPGAGDEERVLAARDPILCMAMSPSAKWLMTGNQDCSIHVWNTDSGTEMHMRGYPAKVRQLAWHRGSRWVATGGGAERRGLGLLGTRAGRTHADHARVSHRSGDRAPLSARRATGSPRARATAASPSGRPPSASQLITGAKIASGVTRVAWSPDGKLLAVGGEAGEVQVLAVE